MAVSKGKKCDLFGELMEGVAAMRGAREGKITLRTHQVERLSLPALTHETIRNTRERLKMPRR
jgi:putative transcriptional regulator